MLCLAVARHNWRRRALLAEGERDRLAAQFEAMEEGEAELRAMAVTHRQPPPQIIPEAGSFIVSLGHYRVRSPNPES